MRVLASAVFVAVLALASGVPQANPIEEKKPMNVKKSHQYCSSTKSNLSCLFGSIASASPRPSKSPMATNSPLLIFKRAALK